MSDIKRGGSAWVICIRIRKTPKGLKCVAIHDPNIEYVRIFNKYLSLRPNDVTTDFESASMKLLILILLAVALLF